MAVHKISKSQRVGEAHKILAAGTYVLDAQTGKPDRCARRITAMADGTISLLWDSGENDEPPGTVTAGMVFDGDYSKITCSAAVYVQW